MLYTGRDVFLDPIWDNFALFPSSNYCIFLSHWEVAGNCYYDSNTEENVSEIISGWHVWGEILLQIISKTLTLLENTLKSREQKNNYHD